MTNEERYKTTEERVKAFEEFCENRECIGCPLGKLSKPNGCRFAWLALEAEEQMPCPFCGARCDLVSRGEDVRVSCSECDYQFGNSLNRGATIAAHNRVCKAVKNAATPELYQALMEAVEDKCHFCTASKDERRELCDQCIVADWKDALAEAAGEEVRDGK